MAALEKAIFMDEDKTTKLTVQFNPNSLEYSYARGSEYGKQLNQAAGGSQQQGTSMDTTNGARLSMRLFFHTYTNETKFENVQDKIEPLRSFLCKKQGEKVVNKKITFAWGSLGFCGYLDSLSVTYQMFAMNGTPVQAEVSISIDGDDVSIPKETEKQQTNNQDEKAKKEFSWLFS